MRDALATVGNVEAALRSGRHVPAADEIDELHRALDGLREAFALSAHEAIGQEREARTALAAFARGRVAEVEGALTDPSAPAVAERLQRAATDLDAAAGLLELSERAAEGAPVEVSVATLAEQALQLAWTIRSQGALGVHVRPSATDCSVSCDPHVVARVLAIAVAAVHAVSPAVAVRTRVEDDAGVIEVTGYTLEDDGAAVMQTRLVARVDPTEAVLAAAARSAQIELVVEPGRVLVRCPRVP